MNAVFDGLGDLLGLLLFAWLVVTLISGMWPRKEEERTQRLPTRSEAEQVLYEHQQRERQRK